MDRNLPIPTSIEAMYLKGLIDIGEEALALLAELRDRIPEQRPVDAEPQAGPKAVRLTEPDPPPEPGTEEEPDVEVPLKEPAKTPAARPLKEPATPARRPASKAGRRAPKGEKEAS